MSLLALAFISQLARIYISLKYFVLFWDELRLVIGYSWPNLGKLLNYNLLATQNFMKRSLHW